MNTKRMLSVLIAGLAGLLFWQFGFGALFPWSPIKPGYSSRQFAAGTVYFPSDLIPNPQYAETDRLIRKRPVFAVCTACRSVVMMWGWWMLS